MTPDEGSRNAAAAGSDFVEVKSAPSQGSNDPSQGALQAAPRAAFRVSNGVFLPKRMRRGRKAKRGASGGTALSLVPSLQLTTTVRKTFRYLLTSDSSDWLISIKDSDMLRMLAGRVGATTGIAMFSAFRLVRVTMYTSATSTYVAGSSLLLPQLAWLTNGTTGTDTKPDDRIPAVTDVSHTSVVEVKPPSKSILGFWNNVATGVGYVAVFGPAIATQSYTTYVDIELEVTLPDGENQASIFGATAFPAAFTWCQRLIAGTGVSKLTPVGYPTYS